jgi:hypothetical protein
MEMKKTLLLTTALMALALGAIAPAKAADCDIR